MKLHLGHELTLSMFVTADAAKPVRTTFFDLNRRTAKNHDPHALVVQLAVSHAILMKRLSANSIPRPALAAAVAVVGLSFCSCALHKPPPHPTIVVRALPKATPLPSAWSSTANTLNVDDGWLKSFQDGGLEAIVSEAIANNLDLRQSAAPVESTRQSVIVVGSKLKPQVNAPLSTATTRSTDNDVTQQKQSSTVLVGAAWEIEVWGRLRAQRAAAKENYEAIALDHAFARQSIAATTAKSWYLAIETRQLLALTEQSVNIYTNLFELVKVRRAAGKVGDLDVDEARYQLDEAQTN